MIVIGHLGDLGEYPTINDSFHQLERSLILHLDRNHQGSIIGMEPVDVPEGEEHFAYDSRTPLGSKLVGDHGALCVVMYHLMESAPPC